MNKVYYPIALMFILSSIALAQTPAISGGMAAEQRDVRSALISPGTASTLLPFVVDPSGQGGDQFHVISTDPVAIVTLLLPNGTEINASNAASFGYGYTLIAAAPPGANNDSIPSPYSNPGTQTIIDLPQTPPVGNYQIRINASATTNKTLIVATYYSSSAISAGVITDQESYKVGEIAVISAFILNGGAPITNATVMAEVREASIPSAFTSQISLQDSGTYDAATGDGIYSGSFTVPVAGRYAIVIRATGTSPSGVNFSRTATTTINIRSSTANFASFSAAGLDPDGNGRIDQVEISANLNVQAAGDYRFVINLEGSNGKYLRASGEASLSSGSQQIKASFPASDFIDLKTGQLKLGTNGPFAMKKAELRYVNTTDAFIADARGTAGNTGIFSFERNPIIFTGPNSVTAVDTNSNGKFDLLRVQVPVDVLTTGNYVWQAYLTDPTGAQVAFFSLADSQPALLVSGSNTISFTLNGQHINRSQRNGPYSVRAVIYAKSGGATGSTSVDNLVTTSAYSYTQFEPPILLECRNYQYTLPAGQSSVIANYSLPQVRGALYPVTTTCTPPPGSSFAAGTTTVNCTTTESISNLATSCSFNLNVISSADTTPPTITCPSTVYATIPYGQGSGPVTYPAPVVTDDRGGATYTCTPASGSNFFRGTTTVSCTARDTSNNQASCSFNVTVFDVSLQDNQMKHTLWFDSVTGDYYFFSCDGSGYTLSGRGTITRVGCEIRLGNDARVSATFVACASTPSVRYGNAVIKPNPIGGWFYITDGNSLDNLRQCPLQ